MRSAGWAAAWRYVREKIAEALYPRAARCLCCGDPRRASPEDCLCDTCRRALRAMRVPPQACNRCLSPVRPGQPCAFCRSPLMRPIEAVYAPYRYGGPVRQLIHAFKFNACGEALPLLSDAMAEALGKREFDCIAPVPLHPRRLRQRGFAQALLLAQALSARTAIPCRALLRRATSRRPPSTLPMKKRNANVADAFSCAAEAKGLRVLLVDDVRTSGSTAHACARALMKAGAESVCLCVCAVVYRKK